MDRPHRSYFRSRAFLIRVAIAVAFGWFVSMATVLTWALEDDAQHADAIVVMGAAQYNGHPSPVLRARLDHAIALWQRGLAARMLLTGGTGEGDVVSEAAAGRMYVMSRGVPDTAILLENEGRTSSQSLRAAADLLQAYRMRSVIIVSDPFHMLRLEILGRRYGLDPLTSPALPTPGSRRLFRQWATLVVESLKAPLALFIDW
ncbi:MAG: YdcF family protein [Gemmatimonadetes bacterium]|nr:YdcF family protein [Gemmatimonadota bacterium]